MPKQSVFKEFLGFIWQEKMWWMIPLLLVGGLITFLMVAGSSPFGAFVYALF